jgi:DNA primase
LYGIDKARLEIRKKDSCILVEGYTDVILAHQIGNENVVATSGTALTPFQLKILSRYSNNLILGFDMDVAGDTATKRGIDLAQSQGFNIKIIRLPEGKDAADVISTNPKEWERALSEPKSILEFYFESAFSGKNPKNPEDKKEISKILLPVLKRIPNKIEQSFWIQKLAKDLEVKEEDVREEMKKIKLEEQNLLSPNPNLYGLEPEEMVLLPQKSRKELLEERLITLIFKNPQNLNLIGDQQINFLSPIAKEVLEVLKKNSNPEELPQDTKDFFNYLALKSEIEEIDEENIDSEIKFCLKEIQSIEIKNKLEEISKEIKKAEEEKNWEEVKKLTQEFNRLCQELI